jgi:hypothetical protein
MRSSQPLILSAFLALTASAFCAADAQLFNLSEKPTSDRFKLTDKTWPEKAGEADICLWLDDKLAALSLGVDDNFPGEIDWWKEHAERYDFKVTWFVITGNIVDKGRSNGGTWAQFQELERLGHAVESHTVTHLHVTEPGWGTSEWSPEKAAAAKRASAGKPKGSADASYATESAPAGRPKPDEPVTDVTVGVNWEYAESIKQIEANIPGKKVSALAYPGGKNTVYNNRDIAAKYYRVARGATGAPNMANRTDYMSTNALSRWDFDSDRGGNPLNILERERYRGHYYRGWAVLFAHGVSADPALFARTFEFIKENRDRLWVGLYTDVAKYGQQRDTATLTVVSADDAVIRLEVKDRMDDTYFNHPLTVKVRLPDAWKTVAAKQADKATRAQLVQHEGAPYALVDVVPDAGLVTVSAN